MKISREDLKQYTILLIDDEVEILDPLRSILKHKFKDVFIATNGEEGLESFKENRPDLIITDIRMPKMGGLDMAERIKEIDPFVPIVISSAFNETDLLLRAIDIGICQYLLKPIEIEKLFYVVEHCIKHKLLEDKIEAKNRELKHKNRKLTEYKNAIELSSIVSRTNKEGTILEVNKGFEEYMGYSKESIIGKNCNFFKSPSEMINQESILKAIEEDGFYKTISEEIQKSGKAKYSNLTIIPTYNEKEEYETFLHLREDITSVVTRIYTDPLTNYPNRAELSKDLKTTENPILAFFNIDSFKEINDFYGNDIGDFVLKNAISVMDRYLKDKEINYKVYKLSSDEFAVLVDNPIKQYIVDILKDLQLHLEKFEFKYLDYSIELNFSVGFTNESEDILVKTDMAIKFAKNNNRSFIDFKDVPDFRESFKDNIHWTRKLKKALEEDRIITYYQPIVDCKDNSISKYECLVRMVDEDGEIISPFKFLNIAYKTRLSKKLTKRVIDKSFKYFQDKEYDFSINLAASDIVDEDIKEYLIEKVEEYNVANRLIIEILESEEISLYSHVKEFVKEIKAKGVKVAVDDFGSGYSNFMHLLNLEIDIIKIDGSIIKIIDKDSNSFAIAKTITDFAKNLNIKTVAEFVHSEGVLEKIKDLEIDFSQGFYTGKPISEIL